MVKDFADRFEDYVALKPDHATEDLIEQSDRFALQKKFSSDKGLVGSSPSSAYSTPKTSESDCAKTGTSRSVC